MLNYTRIPAPRVTIVDPQTGIVSNEWFRFFNNLYTIAYAATGSVTPGTYGSATAVPQITVDDFGTITGISNVAIAIDASQIVSGTIASARISGAYTGITGVGTLTVGTWNASTITTPYGGTGLTSYTAGDTLYYASGTALTKLAIGASTFINTSSGTAPQWTNPSTITIGKATNLVGGAANRIAYQTATDTTGFIVAPTVSNTYLEWSGTAFQWSSNPLGTVTSVSVVSANGLAGTVATATTTPAITLSTTVTGLLKGNGTAISAASSGTDYAPATSGTSILYGDGAGGFSNVTIGTGVSFAAGTLSATGSGGTVTSVAALTLGTTGTDLSSTVANGTTTPVITLNVPTASSVNRGALSAADWTTFNSKAPGVTFTTNYIPYGQGTTTLNQSAGLQFDGTNFTTTGFATATSFRPSASTVPTNGMYLPAANTIGFATNSTLRMSIDANGNSGFGIAPIANVRLASYDTNATVYTSTGATASPVGSVLALGNLSNTNGGYVGISFGANQAAGTGSATYIGNFSNTGSLTGTMVFGRRTGSATYAESMRIDSAGNLGLGVTPSAWNTNWDVLETPTGAFASYATSDPTTIISSNAYISTTSSTTGSIYKNTGYATMYRQTQGAHTWFTAPSGTAGTAITFTTAMTLNANGGCQHLNTISVGNATPSTSGAGITFPATQSASTNANTLDDYEEGTWTPTSAGTTTSGTGTYTIQVGRYTKIGDVVYFYAFVSWSAHTGTGDLLLSSLPFTSSNTTALSPVVNVVGSSLTFLNQLYGGVNGNSTNVAIRTMSTAAATAAVAMDTAATLIVTGFYYV